VYRNNIHCARKYSDSLTNPYESTMAPYQTTVMLDDTRDGQDVVEVQILPQVITQLYFNIFTWYI
jgi:hypothetical protein